MLEKEFKYYLDNQSALVKKYNGKVIVIIGEEIIGVYSNKMDAYKKSIEDHESGTFLIMECTPGNDSYIITQRSRVLAMA